MSTSTVADEARLAYARMLRDGFEKDILECERNQKGWLERGINPLSAQYLYEIALQIRFYNQLIWQMNSDIEIYESYIAAASDTTGKVCKFCGKTACWECIKEGDFEAGEKA